MAKKMFYSMGEVAEMFDVKPSLLRHWEAKFDILKPHKNKKGNRMFTPEDVENLKLIYHLVKERGMTLAGAAQYLKNGITDAMRRDMELLDRLQKIRAELVEVREQLKDVPDGYTVVEVAAAEPEEEVAVVETEEVAAAEPEGEVAEVAPETAEEVVESDDDEQEIEVEEEVELIFESDEEEAGEVVEEDMPNEEPEDEPAEPEEEPQKEEPTEQEQKQDPKQEQEPEDEPADTTPRPRGAKGGRRSKKQEAKLFDVKPEKQRPIAPFFDQTLF